MFKQFPDLPNWSENQREYYAQMLLERARYYYYRHINPEDMNPLNGEIVVRNFPNNYAPGSYLICEEGIMLLENDDIISSLIYINIQTNKPFEHPYLRSYLGGLLGFLNGVTQGDFDQEEFDVPELPSEVPEEEVITESQVHYSLSNIHKAEESNYAVQNRYLENKETLLNQIEANFELDWVKQLSNRDRNLPIEVISSVADFVFAELARKLDLEAGKKLYFRKDVKSSNYTWTRMDISHVAGVTVVQVGDIAYYGEDKDSKQIDVESEISFLSLEESSRFGSYTYLEVDTRKGIPTVKYHFITKIGTPGTEEIEIRAEEGKATSMSPDTPPTVIRALAILGLYISEARSEEDYSLN